MRTASAVLVMLTVSGLAWAEGKTVVVASGDCADPSLISGARDFRDTASRLLGGQLMGSESVLDIVRPRPTRSVQDIERQVESAKSLFYGGNGERALELLERALRELERASPEAQPWPVTKAALVLAALVQKNLERPREMNEAFRRIVRLDPTFKLDPDAHPPSAIAALEAVKRELARSRKSTLQVRVDAGPAATVFVDGLAMGATPLKLELSPGTYRISLSAAGGLSFPHRVELPRDTKLNVDLAFEGSLGLQAPLCLSGSDDGAALKLAQLVTAQRVIVLRNTAGRGAPPFLSGSLYELSTGEQERVGSVAPALLRNLATFLITGEGKEGIQGNSPGGELEKRASDLPRIEPPPMSAHQPTFDVKGVSPGRVASFTLLGAGAATLLTGLIVYGAGDGSRSRLAGITNKDTGKLPLYSIRVGVEATELLAEIEGNNALSFSLIGGGVGALAAGALGLMLFPSGSASLSLSPQPGGASMQLRGKF